MARPQNNKQENASIHIDDSTIRPVLDEFGKHLASPTDYSEGNYNLEFISDP